MKKKILLSLILQMIHKYLSNGMRYFGYPNHCPMCIHLSDDCDLCIIDCCVVNKSYITSDSRDDYTIRLFFWCLMWDHVNQQPPVFFSKLSNIRQLSATLDIRVVDTYKMYKSSGVDWKHEFVIKAVEILKN